MGLYTVFVAGTATRFVPTAAEAKKLGTAQLRDLATFRWAVFAVVLVGMVGYIYSGWKSSKAVRSFPVPETLAAVIAFGAWAFAMPDGLVGLLADDKDLAVVSLGVATAAAAALLGLSAPLRNATTNAIPPNPPAA